MIIEQLSIVVSRGKREEMGRSLAALIGPTLAEPGCLGCRVLQAWTNLGELSVEARWGNKNDLIRHLQSDTYKTLLLLMELSTVVPVLAFYTVQEVQGLDLVKKARD